MAIAIAPRFFQSEIMNSESSSDGRILVLEPDEQLASAILTALREVAPAAVIDVAHSLEEAQRLVLGAKPDLFVLDVDAREIGEERGRSFEPALDRRRLDGDGLERALAADPA